MSAKIYAVWGSKGSGKTTFAVNLACALAKQEKLVGLISSNLTYGELQIFFGEGVPSEKGLWAALKEESPNIGECFCEYEESKNLFYLSLPTGYSGLLSDTVSLQRVELLLNNASLVFDILIVDGAPEADNPVSGVGLWLAERIFTVHKPSIRAQLWHRSLSDFTRELHLEEKQIHLLRAPNGEFDGETYRSMTGLPFPWELPYVKGAEEMENAGRPLCFSHERVCRRYGRVLEEIAGKIYGNGKRVVKV